MTRRFLSPGERRLLAGLPARERRLLTLLMHRLDARLAPDSELPAAMSVQRSLFEGRA